MTDARVASLLAFYQSRSSGDCEKQAGGKFAVGNDCAKSSGGGQDQKKPASPGGGTMPTGKVEDPSAGYSWLSPSGTFHPFPRSKPPQLRLKSPHGFTSHDEWAKLHGVEGGEKELLSKGWARVLRAGSSLYASTADGTALTSGQRKSLKDHAIIDGTYDEVLHDAASGGRVRRTLWAKDQRSFCPTGEGGGIDNSCGADLRVSHVETKDAFGKDTYELNGESLKNYRYSIEHAATGGRATLKVGAYTDYSDGDFAPKATEVNIVSWSATPLSQIATHGLAAEAKYKGKGFGRAVMKAALQIADKHNATVLSIFAPSEDSQAVMKHYSDTGLLEPIKSSKAVYGDYFTSFTINKEKAREFVGGKKPSSKTHRRSADCGRDSGGRFGPKNTCQEMGDEFKPMPHGDWKSVKPDPGYVYHATTAEAAADITAGGLLTFGPSYGTDQEAWPDGSDKDRAYFATSPASAYSFAPENGRPVLLRVPRLDSMEDESGTGDVVSHSPVDASKLEALGSDGVWIPLRRTPASPSFDRWFEDSQVVDESGRPKILFHGTDADFEEFDAGELGFHFGDEQAASMQGGKSMPVVLSIKNPLRLKDLGVWNPDRALKAIRKETDIPKEEIDEAESESDKLHDRLVDRLEDEDAHVARKAHYEWSAPVRELLDRHGYDGIVYQNEAEGYGDSYIAFRPEQIKSASENSGDYDPTKKSIKRSADCGRDEAGRFTSGNTCQALLDQLNEVLGDHEAEGGKVVGGLRDNFGAQTDVGRKLHQMGVKEEALADLIKQMGGQPANTRSQIAKHVVHIAVVSNKGEDLYHIDLGYMEAKIYATGARDHDLEKVKAAAEKAFPSTYFRKGTPFEVHMYDNDDDFKEGKFTDKSSRSLSLRMESLKAFHDSRSSYDGIDFSPPQAVREAAKKGLAWRREHGRGGTAIGIARARDLSNGKSISPSTARRMKAYFDRHQSDKQGEGWSSGSPGYPSNGKIAWHLWGSDAGYAWARKLVRQMEAADRPEPRNCGIGPGGFQPGNKCAHGLSQNSDGTVTVYHHTSPEKAESIKLTGVLKSDGEPHVYVTTHDKPDTGYGAAVVPVMVRPEDLEIDDEFPGGRKDFRIPVGKPGGSFRVTVGRERRNCGIGPGGFQPGNTCAHSKAADVAAGAAKGAAVGAGSAVVGLAPYPPYIAKGAVVGAAVGAANGLARNLTRASRIKAKIAEIGTTEKKVEAMVKKLGGTSKTKADVKGDALHISVVNSQGQKVFNVDMTKSKIVVYPRRATGKLSDAEISKVKDIAKASVPKTTEIVVKSHSRAYVSKLIKSGFKVLADTAGALIAAYVVPPVVDVVAGDVSHAIRNRQRGRNAKR